MSTCSFILWRNSPSFSRCFFISFFLSIEHPIKHKTWWNMDGLAQFKRNRVSHVTARHSFNFGVAFIFESFEMIKTNSHHAITTPTHNTDRPHCFTHCKTRQLSTCLLRRLTVNWKVPQHTQTQTYSPTIKWKMNVMAVTKNQTKRLLKLQ